MTLERRNKVFDIIITHSIAEGHPRLCQTVQCGIFYSYSSRPNHARTYLQLPLRQWGAGKVIREKSRGEGSLIVQDTIENVSESKFFFLTF